MIQILALFTKSMNFLRSTFSALLLPASWFPFVLNKMEGPQNREDSWGTLSAVFSKLELSLSRDSCYASDEIPAPSAVATAAATPDLSPVPAAELSLAPVPVLKSILKKPCRELEAEDTESESGYESDDSESRYDASSDCDLSASQDFDGGKCYCRLAGHPVTKN